MGKCLQISIMNGFIVQNRNLWNGQPAIAMKVKVQIKLRDESFENVLYFGGIILSNRRVRRENEGR